MSDTIFHKIISKELPADIVFENENIIAIKDIAPKAPVHLLIIPKKTFKDINEVQADDANLLAEIIIVAQKLATDFGVEKGYRLLTNCGETAGQTVFQLHFHLLGGRNLGEMG